MQVLAETAQEALHLAEANFPHPAPDESTGVLILEEWDAYEIVVDAGTEPPQIRYHITPDGTAELTD